MKIARKIICIMMFVQSIMVYSQQSLQLFVYQNCIFCTRVIDFLQQHHLTDKVMLIDAEDIKNNKVLQQVSGKTQAPYLVDIDDNIKMPESLDIIAYLSRKFNISQATDVDILSIKPQMIPKYDAATFLTDVKASTKPVLVLVATTWCLPCQEFKPIFEEVAQEQQGSCIFIVVDGNVNFEIVQQLEVKVVPTLICFKDGKQINPKDYKTKKALLQLVVDLEQL